MRRVPAICCIASAFASCSASHPNPAKSTARQHRKAPLRADWPPATTAQPIRWPQADLHQTPRWKDLQDIQQLRLARGTFTYLTSGQAGASSDKVGQQPWGQVSPFLFPSLALSPPSAFIYRGLADRPRVERHESLLPFTVTYTLTPPISRMPFVSPSVLGRDAPFNCPSYTFDNNLESLVVRPFIIFLHLFSYYVFISGSTRHEPEHHPTPTLTAA